ncbi:MAG: DUF123 domain-containing protein [Alphaproteobacteria bacterium]|nr:DUF123 domain-containing protein [Alphaproteobacteria bacterium]
MAPGGVRLRPGLYLYGGSAHGPGGLRARIRRHAKADKPCHWHIDRLTGAGRLVAAFAIRDGQECAVVAAAAAVAGATFPAPGFGSSDCRNCVGHLVRLPAGSKGYQSFVTQLIGNLCSAEDESPNRLERFSSSSSAGSSKVLDNPCRISRTGASSSAAE